MGLVKGVPWRVSRLDQQGEACLSNPFLSGPGEEHRVSFVSLLRTGSHYVALKHTMWTRLTSEVRLPLASRALGLKGRAAAHLGPDLALFKP